MSQQLVNMVAKRALKDTAKKNINSKDPYFEEVAVYGKDGRPSGKVKKQKKGIPLGVSQHDGKILKKVRRRAYRLDLSLFNCCGFRFGWSAVIGIVPVIGDALDLLMAWNVVRTCAQIEGGLPAMIRSRMYFNIMLDFAIGLVPFLGDVADAVFRANTRNAWILEEYLTKKAEAQGQRAAANSGDSDLPDAPRPAKTNPFSGRSFLGGKSRQGDEEMGMASVGNNGGQSNRGHG